MVAACRKSILQQGEELFISTDARDIQATGTRGDSIQDNSLLSRGRSELAEGAYREGVLYVGRVGVAVEVG